MRILKRCHCSLASYRTLIKAFPGSRLAEDVTGVKREFGLILAPKVHSNVTSSTREISDLLASKMRAGTRKVSLSFPLMASEKMSQTATAHSRAECADRVSGDLSEMSRPRASATSSCLSKFGKKCHNRAQTPTTTSLVSKSWGAQRCHGLR